jgi:hypothetical protein
MDNFEKYQKFVDEENFNETIMKLESANIKYDINDKSFSINDLSPGMRTIDIDLYISKMDFEKADKVLLAPIENQHYLYEFTDQELVEIVVNEDEWNEFDLNLAKTILKERGKEINEDLLKSFKDQRIIDLSKPEESQKGWIVAGYVFAILGGLISIFIGYHLKTYKKRLPNGEKVYAFIDSDRVHGNRIFILGIIFGGIYLILRIL